MAMYLVIAPFYLIDDTGIYGFPMFVLAAYFLLGIELVAEEIEEPFGPGGDNLPLERYCATIATRFTKSSDRRRTLTNSRAMPKTRESSRRRFPAYLAKSFLTSVPTFPK